MPDKNLVVYPVIFSKDDNYTFVRIPDIDGGLTQGNDLIDAVKMAADAIGILLEDKVEYPTPTAIDELQLEKGETAALIPVDLAAYRRKHSKTVRKSVTIPDYLDRIAKEQKINVSGVLTEALKLRLGV